MPPSNAQRTRGTKYKVKDPNPAATLSSAGQTPLLSHFHAAEPGMVMFMPTCARRGEGW